jgi:hypothetical protein
MSRWIAAHQPNPQCGDGCIDEPCRQHAPREGNQAVAWTCVFYDGAAFRAWRAAAPQATIASMFRSFNVDSTYHFFTYTGQIPPDVFVGGCLRR